MIYDVRKPWLRIKTLTRASSGWHSHSTHFNHLPISFFHGLPFIVLDGMDLVSIASGVMSIIRYGKVKY